MSFFLNSYSFSIPPAAACDPYWSYVTLLLPMETDLEDVKGAETIETGNIALSSAQSPYLTSSAALDGDGDCLSIPYHAGLDPGAGDFCIEAWVYVSSYRTYAALICGTYTYGAVDGASSQNAGWGLFVSESGTLVAGYGDNGAWTNLGTGGTVGLGVWTHVALTRSGSTLSFFTNGHLDTSSTNTANLTFAYKQHFYVGSYERIDIYNFSDEISFHGYIKDVRITKGVARYTADFTPPTEAFAATQCAYTGWTPANGTAPYAWYITDDPANTVTGGNTLTVLVDKSGNGRNISTSLDYAAGAIHSRAAAATGFGGKRLTLPSSTGMLNGAAGWCAAFSLYRIDGGAMSQALFFAETNALNTSRALLAVEGPTDDKPRIVSRRADGDTAAVLDSSVTVGHQDYALVVGGVDLPSKVARILANGVETISAPFGTTGNTFSATNSYSGPYLLDTNASGGGGSEQYIGNVGEIVLYNSAISLAEMRKLEGYLAWTWGMLDKLPSDHPYRTTQPQADASWTPAAEPSVLVWLDATDASTVTLTSSEVTNLASKGNSSGVNAVPVSAGTRPEYATAVVNGKNVLRFNGTSDGMYVTGITGAIMTDLFRNRQSGWAIAAYASNPSMSSATPKHVFFVNRNNAVEYTRFSLMQSQATANSPAMATRRLDADAYQSIEGTTNHGLDWLIAVAHADWQNSDGYLWVNGSSAASTTSLQTAGNTSDTASISSPHLGCAGDTGGSGIQQFMQGDLAHLIVGVGPLTTDMRQKIEGYLAHQLGLTGSLPGGHPYKAVAP